MQVARMVALLSMLLSWLEASCIFLTEEVMICAKCIISGVAYRLSLIHISEPTRPY